MEGMRVIFPVTTLCLTGVPATLHIPQIQLGLRSRPSSFVGHRFRTRVSSAEVSCRSAAPGEVLRSREDVKEGMVEDGEVGGSFEAGIGRHQPTQQPTDTDGTIEIHLRPSDSWSEEERWRHNYRESNPRGGGRMREHDGEPSTEHAVGIDSNRQLGANSGNGARLRDSAALEMPYGVAPDPPGSSKSHNSDSNVSVNSPTAFHSGGQRLGESQCAQLATQETPRGSLDDVCGVVEGEREVQGWHEGVSDRAGGGVREDLSGARVGDTEGEDGPRGTRSEYALPNMVGEPAMRDAICRGALEEACEALQLMGREGAKPGTEDLGSLIRLCAHQGDARSAIAVFKAGIESGALPGKLRVGVEAKVRRIANLALRDCGRRGGGGGGEALALFEEMEGAGMRLGGESFKAVIMACCQAPEVFQGAIRKHMFRMREGGLLPDTRLCNTVIRALGQAKKWWAALEVYEVMTEEGPVPDQQTTRLITAQFELLLDSARKRRLWKWAIQLLERMDAAGIPISGRAWCTCLVTCARAGRTEAAVGIFKLIVEQGRRPGIIEYGALLSALEKGGMLERAVEVWEHMQRIGVSQNGPAYVTMITVFGNGGQYGEAVRIFEEMRACDSCPVDVVAFNAVITACAKSGQGIRALLWMEQMRSESVEADEVTYQQALEALANEGLWEEATALYLKGRDGGLSMTQRSYDMVAGVREANGRGHELSEIGERKLDVDKNGEAKGGEDKRN